MEKERELPEIQIEGTPFLVDVQTNMFREKADPENELSLFYMDMREKGYGFSYDKQNKTFRTPHSPNEDCVYVRIKPLAELDPEGLAAKYGYAVDQIKGKSDFEIMVDQQALEKRLNGHLPTIEIAEHTFYIDYNMEMLRPKDDFLSKGISFKELEDYSDFFDGECRFPYDPKTREIRNPDFDTITEFPKDLIVVSLPPIWQLDPVAHARVFGIDRNECLMRYGIQLEFKAEKIPWEKTGITEDIKRNLAKKKGEKKQTNRKKGRGI